jgi:hypothetical protein
LTHYDAELSNGQETEQVEVKTHHRSKETLNFFIETIQYGKASVITVTEADYYVIDDAAMFFLICVR